MFKLLWQKNYNKHLLLLKIFHRNLVMKLKNQLFLLRKALKNWLAMVDLIY